MEQVVRTSSCLVILVFISRLHISSAQSLGAWCADDNGAVGVCKLLPQCAIAVQMIQQNLGHPKICDFHGNTPVVCCDERLNVRTTTTRRPVYIDTQPTFTSTRRPYTNSNHHTNTKIPQDNFNRPPVENYRPYEPENESVNGGSISFESEFQTTRPPYTSKSPSHGSRPVHKPPDQSRPSNSGVHGKPPHRHPNRPSGLLSKSEAKCREYAEQVTETVEALPLVPNPEPVSFNVEKCDYSGLPLIVGGEKTMVGEFPHMAALGYVQDGRISWLCGGSLISERYVLTAAHCASSSLGPPQVVRLGEHNLKRDDDGARPVDYEIEQIIKHPDYRPTAKYNDIAVLKLNRPVRFSKFIRPACLYSRNTYPGNKTVATGWGRIDYAENPSDVLLKVTLSIIDNDICNGLYKADSTTNKLSRGIVSSMMCAGELRGGKDTCQGDSGGPIQIKSRNNQCVYYIIGVTSFGKYCAARNAPGVYSRVSSFVPWIESVVWP